MFPHSFYKQVVNAVDTVTKRKKANISSFRASLKMYSVWHCGAFVARVFVSLFTDANMLWGFVQFDPALKAASGQFAVSFILLMKSNK